jgi:hypothetical protein
MKTFKLENEQVVGQRIVAAICPGCGREGNLSPFSNIPDLQTAIAHPDRPNTVNVIYFGQRVCPNTTCRTHVFVVYDPREMLLTYPVGLVDFDSSHIPGHITSTFEEALICFAHDCYAASAMMIRKTLELVCEERGASGDNLKARLAALRDKVTLPTDLFSALDHLRLLGNDAAHVEAKAYLNVGEPEVAAGIELTKEIVKAVYQHKGLVAKLLALKK